MSLVFKLLILLIALASCATQRVEIKISKNNEPESKSTYLAKNEPIVTIDDTDWIDTNVQDMRYKIEKNIDTCPKFELPTLKPIPSIPKDIQNKKRMSDEDLIVLLTEYARQLRKVSLENQLLIQTKYKQYNEMCKK